MASKKTLIITGASTGIGEATARQAAAAGWNLVLAARRMDKLGRIEAELGPDRALAHQCDVADWRSQQALNRPPLNGSEALMPFLPMRDSQKAPPSTEVKTGPTNGVKWCWSMCSGQQPPPG